jgi:hypothetical protein
MIIVHVLGAKEEVEWLLREARDHTSHRTPR